MSEAPRQVALFRQSETLHTEAAIRRAGEVAAAAGVELIAAPRELEGCGDVPGITVAEELPESPDLCLALGGDGTMLRALRRFANRDVPVFGVNYGTVGFLASVERDQLDAGLQRAFAGEFEVVSMPGLELRGVDGGQIAVNDVSFTRKPHQRVAQLSYSVSGQEVGRVRCDGLVAATPAGSTGYNLANNGPILAWGVEGFVVSFIAPHTLTARALVVAPDDELHVANVDERNPVEVGVDGISAGQVEPGAEVRIGFRDGMAKLAQLEGQSFYRRIREKFGRLAH
jgi:NAD+ kinase